MNTRTSFTLFAAAAALTGLSCTRTVPVPAVPTTGAVQEEMVEADGAVAAGDSFLVKLETTKGDIVIEVHPGWAPEGAKRFRELVEIGFYDNCAFFRVLPGFMAQVGMNGDPELHAKWSNNNIPDDPVVKSNTRGYVTFAQTAMPNTRSTQFFINYGDSSFLDAQRFAPFGVVKEGMEYVDDINPEYRESPDQNQISLYGAKYLTENFPNLDYILKATILEAESEGGTDTSDAADSSAEADTDANAKAEPDSAAEIDTASDSSDADGVEGNSEKPDPEAGKADTKAEEKTADESTEKKSTE